jgi:serine/threonine-protein kinase
VVRRKKGEPARIGRYEIRGELGRGMMGVVYRAFDPALGRPIALKTVRPIADSRARRKAWERRFLTEAQAAARLSHPAIVVVHDVGRDAASGVLYMALEYLEGETLAERIASGRPLPWREAARIVARVAEALHAAHGQGIVHRDVKPANVMVLRSGQPKVLDFGVAHLDAGSLTAPGDLFGTPLYMSPEQAAGGTVDARSDIFSLGAVTWALLTGRSPFEAGSLGGILARVMHRDPPPPSTLAADVPPEVDDIVTRALSKAPGERYPSAASLAEDLDDVLAGRVPRHRKEWTPPPAAGRTLASSAGRNGEPPLLEVPDEPPPPAGAHRPRRTRLRTALMLVLAGSAGLYFYLHPVERALLAAFASRELQPRLDAAIVWVLERARTWTRRPPTPPAPTAAPEPTPAPTPPPEPAPTPSPTPSPTPTPEPASATQPTASQPTPTPPPMPTPQPTPPPEPTPAPKPKAAPPRARRAPPSYLSVGFEHSLKSGVLEVWVDGERVAQETLDSRATKKMLLFTVRKGSVQETLELPPGRHEVRVRLVSGGETKAARVRATFRSGATRRLEVKLARLSGKIELEWK